MRTTTLAAGVLLTWASTTGTVAALSFTPEAGYTASVVWSGAEASHFAVENGDFYIYGAQDIGGGQLQSVVRLYDGTSIVEIARSPAYAVDTYSADAITVVNGDVYWAHVNGAPPYSYHANICKTSYDGGAWSTTTILDESAGINVFSLCTDGNNVFGVGLDNNDSNVAFFLDSAGGYEVLAEIPGYSGGSGFDPAGNFFAGACDPAAFTPHMYEFSAQQVADRLSGAQLTPYAVGDAVADHVVPGNASAVMESDGASLFGTKYNATWTGTDPFAFNLDTGTHASLGTLTGAVTTVSADVYYRDGSVFFMGKDDWFSGGQAVIYQLVPEPASLWLLAGGALLAMRRRRGVAHDSTGSGTGDRP